MILVDTSIWIDHLCNKDGHLSDLLYRGEVLSHSFVTGELAMGSLKNRATLITDLIDLPQAMVASHNEVLEFIDSRRLFGLGLSFVDAHLLASTQLTPETQLWTRDKRLHEAAIRLSLDFTPKLN